MLLKTFMTETVNCFRKKKRCILREPQDRYLFEILHTSFSMRLGKNVVKSRPFWNLLRSTAQHWAVQGVLCKNILLADLLRNQQLLEILQTSRTFKNSENMEKNDCFEKHLRWRPPSFLSKWRRDIKSLVWNY